MAFTAIGKYSTLSETIAVCMDILHFVHDMTAGFISSTEAILMIQEGDTLVIRTVLYILVRYT
jgi:hypothetical protein